MSMFMLVMFSFMMKSSMSGFGEPMNYLIAGGNQGLVSFDNIKTVREQNLSDKENINRVSATWEKKRLKYYIDSTVDSNYGMSIHYQIVYGAQSWSGLAENAPTKEIGS